MKATISTIMETNADRMWGELQKINSLMQVASPILTFSPEGGQTLPETWQTDNMYTLKLAASYIIPLGNHIIDVKKIAADEREIFTNEYGTLTRTWNHRIWIVPIDNSRIHYTDEVEIEAGVLTPLIWAFAHIFYRHRQRKWKTLLAIRANDLTNQE